MSDCNHIYGVPTVVDGAAYFICEKCGYCYEEENYQVFTKEELVARFEDENKLKLPGSFIDYNSEEDGVVKLPACHTDTLKYYFGEGFYSFSRLNGLDLESFYSIFRSADLVKEWCLPKDLVLIEGDGHRWLALDYRQSRDYPSVIVIETDDYEYLTVADSFDEFTKMILKYDDVYDENGNIIYE